MQNFAYICSAMHATVKTLPVRLPDGERVRAKVSVVPHLNNAEGDMAYLTEDLASIVNNCAEWGTELHLSEVGRLMRSYGTPPSVTEGLGGVLVYRAGVGQSDSVSFWIEPI